MIKILFGLKRRPQIVDEHGVAITWEPWVDYLKRSYSTARQHVDRLHLWMRQLCYRERLNWAQHIARTGQGPKEMHLVTPLIAWRNRWWWEEQKVWNLIGVQPLNHIFPFKPSRWEEVFPCNWLQDFENNLPS